MTGRTEELLRSAREAPLDSIISVLRIPVTIAILLFSVIIHEVSHGVVAEKLGDPTARRQGRITLNPIPHIDLVGSIILPAIAVIMHLPLLGWAKPVPIDMRQFKDPMRDFAITAMAGPVSNLAQVMVYSLVFHVSLSFGWLFVATIASWGIYINLLLALFNLLPIPPLDGSRLIAAALPRDMGWQFLSIGRYGFMILMLLIFSGVLGPLWALVGILHSAIVY
ncbi:MAG: site-2 protease family protein [Candidatus Eisenbacteria bacterium]